MALKMASVYGKSNVGWDILGVIHLIYFYDWVQPG
jgi:hypothetical protein